MSDYEADARCLAGNRVDPATALDGARSARVAAITAWVGGWLLAAKDAMAREHHDPGDEDRSER